MKEHQSKKAIIFIRTDNETKEDFLKAVEISCSDQNTLGELLIKKGAKKIIRKQNEKQRSKTN